MRARIVFMAGRSEKNTLVMMSATLVSRLLGILKSRVISIFFGAGTVADAINFAYNIPNNFRKLFAEVQFYSYSLCCAVSR